MATVNFTCLQHRLITHIRKKVRGGELTERGLGRMARISQPHIHNVLNGKRVLSTAMADQLLRELRIDLLDLLDPSELEGSMKWAPEE